MGVGFSFIIEHIPDVLELYTLPSLRLHMFWVNLRCIFPQEDGILVLPSIADPPLKRNSRKSLLAEFYDRALVLSSISSMSGCCQVIDC